MKQIITLVFLLACVSLSAQKVGVNMAVPEYTLDVRSPSITEPSQFNISNLDKSKYIRFFSGSDMFPDPSMSWVPDKNFIFASFDDATSAFTEYMRISSLGKIGIGIIDPQAKLDVRGGDWNLDAGNPGDFRVGNSDFNLRIGVATGGGGAGISRIYSSNHLLFGVADSPIMMIESGGETGFGTTNPSQRVHVNGKLKIGDDTKAPSEGTIRYNAAKKAFEGYDGSKWINLGGSSPFGNTGTFNLPDTSYSFNLAGDEVTTIEAFGNRIAIRSRTRVPSGIPNVSTYEIYLELFEQQVVGGNWINKLVVSSVGAGSDRNFANSFILGNGFLLVGDPKNKKVNKRTPTVVMGSTFWTVDHTFISPNTTVNDLFGWSIAYDQGKTIIGAPETDINFFPLRAKYGPGHAYIYRSNNTLEATLSGPGPELGDGFGFSADINNNRAIVGTPFNNFGAFTEAGSASVFNFFNNIWSTSATFYNSTLENEEHYGTAVSVEGNDYLYILGEIEGIDCRLVEDGFWVLKETVSGSGQSPEIKSHKTLGVTDLLYKNNPGMYHSTYLVISERDNNNFFKDISFLVNGSSYIVDYDITNDIVYTITDEGVLFEFRKS